MITKKLFLFSIKYIPIIQMVGMIINNTFTCYDIHCIEYINLDFYVGNSFLLFIVLLPASFLFKFCIYHKGIIIANFVNLLIVKAETENGINCTDKELLCIYYIVYATILLIVTFIHIKFKNI